MALPRIGRALAPRRFGERTVPSPWLIVLATIGVLFLLVVATTAWSTGTDEQAYWRAATRFWGGGSMYDPSALPGDTSFGYWYPPPLAQVLAPFTGLIAADVFSLLWTVLLLGCLWWLGGRNVLVGLALIAFLPVAVELRFRNVHLLLAVLLVLSLRRSSLFWVPATAIKVGPVVGLAYLAAARRWRETFMTAVVGAVALGASLLLAPSAWREFFDLVVTQAGGSGASLVPVPYVVRLGAGVAMAVVSGWLARGERVRAGEALLVGAVVVANPTLWVTALSMLVAVVPLWRSADGARRVGPSYVAGESQVSPG